MATNEQIRAAFDRHFEAAYNEELKNDECPNGGPITDQAYELTMAELGLTWKQVDDAIAE